MAGPAQSEDDELIRDFLIESNENLARLDQEIVELEQRPGDQALLASIFRTMHTIKGTCGFLGFSRLEGVAHLAENILNQLRNGERQLTPALVSLVLESVDATRRELAAIEASGQESGSDYADLRRRLTLAAESKEVEAAAPVVAPPPMAEPSAEALHASAVADSTIRVDVNLLDNLMNLVGELVLARNQILQLEGRNENLALNATVQRLNLITTQLQESVMKTRMQPIGVVWNKLPRVVRDLAAACGKQIHLELEGAETELDKSIVEAIKDPLTHIVRNACDHGLESPEERVRAGKPTQGRLCLRAYHEGGQVNIEITDDGRGIDPARTKKKAVERGLLRPEAAAVLTERDAIHLVFQPGFSTAETVTNLSGRGVGMDVVKTNVERIGGSVDLVSRLGQGTAVKVKIPLTLAIIPGLIVRSGGQRFVIPQGALVELVRLEGEARRQQTDVVAGRSLFRRRGRLLPLVDLAETLGLAKTEDNGALNIVVLQCEDRLFGLVVDEVHDTQEIVVKPLGKQLKGLTVYAGATIMGDGRVALILDPPGVGHRAGVLGEHARREEHVEVRNSGDRQPYLLFSAGELERVAVPLALVARLEEFPPHLIERAAGRRVVQYRGDILPLVSLTGTTEPASGEAGPVPVIVFADAGSQVGLIVDTVVDIIEEHIATRRRSQRPGILGSAVLGGKVTDLLDLMHVLREASVHTNLTSQAAGKTQAQRWLLVGSTPFSRALLRADLEMAGHFVREVVSTAEASDLLSEGWSRIVVAGDDATLLSKASELGIPCVSWDAAIGGASQLHQLGAAVAASEQMEVLA